MTDLKLDRVCKKYPIRRPIDLGAAPPSLSERVKSLMRRSEAFWALRDVSFEVARGETLGIIGHNGAGKSTILKLLSSITSPTSGEIRINGRLSALIEVGAGFHPELTGRENVYLNGAILGMRRREITEKLESIVDFAGIRQFIDTPVKRYSSGMYVRLGFSIAAHLDPDILLLDEVLAVGDAAFQNKCLERINELHQRGTTIVFISHNLGAIERLCSRVLLLQRGTIIANGSAREVIAKYQQVGTTFIPSETQSLGPVILSKEAEITSLSFQDAEGRPTSVYETGAPMIARLGYVVHEPVSDASFELYLFAHDRINRPLCQLTTALSNDSVRLEPGEGVVEFSAPELCLLPGMYFVSATIVRVDQPLGTAIDWQRYCATIRVDQGKPVRGRFYMPHAGRIIPAKRSPDADAKRQMAK